MSLEQTLKSLKGYFLFCLYDNEDGKLVKKKFKWSNIFGIFVLHGIVFYIIAYLPLRGLKWSTIIFETVYGIFSGLGVTAGVHRLWTHRSYSATLPLRIFLALCFSSAGQNNIKQWVLDHRVHHKFTETESDPHNAARGFFFSHCGWLMVEKSPEVKSKGKLVDISDVLEDPVVKYHTKYFIPLKILMAFIVPIFIPKYFFGEGWINSIGFTLCRLAASLNFTWAVNSAAHIWGGKPYDKRIGPAENALVSVFALGEGWHNYHHTFPWDYKTGEHGMGPNLTATFLRMCQFLGLAYNLKTPSQDLVNRVAAKYGDGTRNSYHFEVIEPKNETDDVKISKVGEELMEEVLSKEANQCNDEIK